MRKAFFLLRWEAPGFGEDIVVCGKEFQHSIQVASEKIFATNFKHAGKVL